MKPCPRMKRIVHKLTQKHQVDLAHVGAYLRLDMPNYDCLCIEVIDVNRLSVAHFYETKAHRVPEPDIEFFTGHPTGWIPIAITQSLTGLRTYGQMTEDGTGIARYNEEGQADLADFAEQWAMNIQDQGWLERGVPHKKHTRPPVKHGRHLFRLGRVVATPGALDALEQSGQTPDEFLDQHVKGDWGEVPQEDKQANEEALQQGLRLVSAYNTSDGTRIWVITEHDRSVTTLLLPLEY